MAVHSVNDDIITCAAAQEYFTHADRRVMIGLRAALEMLRIPLPEYAARKPPGPAPSRCVAAAFHADTGTRPATKPAYSDPLGQRRLSAAVAKGRARIAKRKAAGLFHDTFTG